MWFLVGVCVIMVFGLEYNIKNFLFLIFCIINKSKGWIIFFKVYIICVIKKSINLDVSLLML